MICNLAMAAPPPRRVTPLAAEGGYQRRRQPRQPLQRWLELMELVEALSPRWPPRSRARRLRVHQPGQWRL